MKRIILSLFLAISILGFSSISAFAAPSDSQNSLPQSKKSIVVYFSATGETRTVAKKVAAVLKADIYEIIPAQKYTSHDLNYRDASTRATVEQNTPSARPRIGSLLLNLKNYDTIYLGYPIWWGEEPRIMDTFVESYDFTGVTVIPFCTSASSGVGRSDRNLAQKAKSGNWKSGTRLKVNITESEILAWIKRVK